MGGWQREGRTRREERETGRARKRESEKGNPGEEERAVVEGHGEKDEMNACLPGCVWNATPRSLSPLERNIGFWTQA